MGDRDALMRLKRLAGSLATIRPPDFIVNAMEIRLRILIEKWHNRKDGLALI